MVHNITEVYGNAIKDVQCKNILYKLACTQTDHISSLMRPMEKTVQVDHIFTFLCLRYKEIKLDRIISRKYVLLRNCTILPKSN